MDLDELLANAAPPVAERTTDLDRELRRLVNDAELVTRPKRHRLSAALVSVVTTTGLGLGTASAMAAGVLPTPDWIPWTTSSGSSCEMQFTARPLDSGNPSSKRYTEAERQAVLDEANRFLTSFDYASVDTAMAIREFQAEEDAAITSQPDPDERQPRLVGDELELTAVGFEVWDALEAHLVSRGMDPTLVGYGQGTSCR